MGDRRALRLLTARTIEKWRTGSARWPASAASRAREGSSCSSRPVTTAEPIISSVERVRRFRALNILLLLAWSALGVVTIAQHMEPGAAVKLALVALAIYFLTAGLFRTPVARDA